MLKHRIQVLLFALLMAQVIYGQRGDTVALRPIFTPGIQITPIIPRTTILGLRVDTVYATDSTGKTTDEIIDIRPYHPSVITTPTDSLYPRWTIINPKDSIYGLKIRVTDPTRNIVTRRVLPYYGYPLVRNIDTVSIAKAFLDSLGITASGVVYANNVRYPLITYNDSITIDTNQRKYTTTKWYVDSTFANISPVVIPDLKWYIDSSIASINIPDIPSFPNLSDTVKYLEGSDTTKLRNDINNNIINCTMNEGHLAKWVYTSGTKALTWSPIEESGTNVAINTTADNIASLKIGTNSSGGGLYVSGASDIFGSAVYINTSSGKGLTAYSSNNWGLYGASGSSIYPGVVAYRRYGIRSLSGILYEGIDTLIRTITPENKIQHLRFTGGILTSYTNLFGDHPYHDSTGLTISSDTNNSSTNVSGMYGVGTVTSSYLPKFSGTTTLTNSHIQDTNSSVIVSCDLKSTGDVIAYYSSSDKRLKKNIQKITNYGYVVNNLNGYTFTWNNNGYKPDSLDIGLIAQEVEALIPTAVVDRGDGYKAVHMEKVIPYLLEYIKSLEKRVRNIEDYIININKR